VQTVIVPSDWVLVEMKLGLTDQKHARIHSHEITSTPPLPYYHSQYMVTIASTRNKASSK
jgi:hypothetical protein